MIYPDIWELLDIYEKIEKQDRMDVVMNKRVILMLVFAVLISLIGCGKNNDEAEGTTEGIKHSTEISVACKSNLIFNKYDVVIYIDDKIIATLDHGKTSDNIIDLTEGQHSFRVEKEDEPDVDGSESFEITEDVVLSCKVTCESDQVVIEDFEVKPVTPENEKKDKAGFDEKYNTTYDFYGLRFSIPSYYGNPNEEKSTDTKKIFTTGFQKEDAVILLQYLEGQDVTSDQLESNATDIIESFLSNQEDSKLLDYSMKKVADYDSLYFTYTQTFSDYNFECSGVLIPDGIGNVYGILFGQSDNTEFDYFPDFEKVLTTVEVINGYEESSDTTDLISESTTETVSTTEETTEAPATTEQKSSLNNDVDEEEMYKDGYLVAKYSERSISGGDSEDVYLKGRILEASNSKLVVKKGEHKWTVEFSTSCDLSGYVGSKCEVYGSNIPGISSRYDTPLIEVRKDKYHIVFLKDGKELYPEDYDSCQQFPQIYGSNENSGGSSMTVWIPTDGGTKYHSYSGCSGMENPKEVTEEEAISEGFSQCGKCW